jgi:hypothetical protein
MSSVYFSREIDRILDKIDYSILGKNVAIKVHFGEMGCVTYLSPKLVKRVYDKIVRLNKKATLVETNSLYKGSRTNAAEHIKTAHSHGFDFAPIDILDGEFGDEEIDIQIDKGLIKNVKLGKGISKYDSLIVLTHFKGHPMTGYGGALKNIGMGLGSRAGKLQMHCDAKPVINNEKCIGCGVCIKNCNYNAIQLTNDKAFIDNKKCVGCAMCIAVCKNKAVKEVWCSTEKLQKKIIDYASGVLKLFPNIIFINFLYNITPECDCFNYIQKPITPDIGILYGKNVVTIDKASLDLANKESNGEFDKINNIDKMTMIDYAFSKGLGEKEYGLIDLD